MYAYLFTHVIYLLALHIWVARSYMYYTCSYYSIARFWFVKVQYDISCEPHKASWCVISLPMVIQLNFCNHESTLDFHSYPANCIIFYYNNFCIILYYLFIFYFFYYFIVINITLVDVFHDVTKWHQQLTQSCSLLIGKTICGFGTLLLISCSTASTLRDNTSSI